MQKTMWIISVCHGEYDDYTDVPVAVVPDQITAVLIQEALENLKQPYFDQIMKNGLEYYADVDFGVNIREVPFVLI